MRPASVRLVTLLLTLVCLVAIFGTLSGLAAGQSAKSKRKVLRQPGLSQAPQSGKSAEARSGGVPPLTTDNWTGASGGSWNTSTNWSAGLPTSSDAVTINTASTVVNLNTGAAGAAGSLTLGSGDTLDVSNETLTDSGTLTNSGTLNVGTSSGGATVTVQGATTNTGTIALGNNSVFNVAATTLGGTVTLNSTGNVTELVLDGNVTLSGGSLTMSNNANNYIFGSSALDQLTNAETIQGAGHIGNGQMALVNTGTINANASAGMTIDANDGFTNTGTVEATAGATLTLTNMGTVNNTGGTISANGSTVQINSSNVTGGNVTLTGAATLQLNTGTFVGGTLTNSSTGTIEIASGTNVLGGTINNSAGGTFKIDNNATLQLEGGTYSQLGTLQLNSSGNFTELVLEGNVTLSGGSVTMSNNTQNYIFGQVSTDTLTNQETISGAGQIGHGQMTLVNSGTINANQSSGITIQANGGVTNTGTLEATSGATLTLLSDVIGNAGGTISANTGTVQVNSSTVNGGTVTLTGASTLQLNSGTIHGGSTLTNSSTGTIEIASGTNVLGGTINNSTGGTFKIDNNAILDLEAGTYSQLGTVQLNSSDNFTELVLDGNVTLSGGTVTLSNNTQNYIFGQVSTDTLTNKETIQGAGQIGHGQMTLVNSGTINANSSSGMTIQANGGVTNTGTLEATSGATLALSSTGVINNAGGTISANTGTIQVTSSTVNGGTVTLTGASLLQLNTGTIHGGSTITNSSTGTIEIASGTNVLGGTINNSAGGTFKIDNNATLDLDGGTYSQLGTLQLNSSGNFTELVLEGNVTLSGGAITMSNNTQNYIFGATSAVTLTNEETISGAGQIGHGQMTLVNSGTINSNQSGGITIQANGGFTNTGTLEATSGATLTLSSTGVVNNAGGTISANTGTLQVNSSTVNGGTITLTGASLLQLNSGSIHAGTLTNSSTGTIEIASGTNVLGGTINNSAGGILKIDNNATLDLESGTYTQLGTVQLNSSGNFTELVLEGNVTLSGGSVTLSNNTQNYIFGQLSTDTLTNQETISGAGQIGNGQMTLVNSGTINSNQTSGITIRANGGVTNTGTLEATSGSTLALSSTGTVNNAGGTISANTGTIQVTSSTINGGTITLTGASSLQLNSGTIHGGSTLTNSSTGTIEIASGTNVLGGTINNSAGGILKIDNNSTLELEGGTYSQLGAVQLNSSGNFTELVIEGNVTLSGGTVTMSANSQNYIFGAAGFDVLTNAETIQGAGNIGNGQMGLVNSGTINANASGNMVINVSNLNFNNTGTVEATGATLTIEGPSGSVNFFTNDNQSTATLTGGTYIANGANIQWNAGPNGITTLAANVTEEGGGQLINTYNSLNANAIAGLTSITSSGSLTIGGTAFTDAGNFSNAGSLTILGGESFKVATLSQISGGSLTAGTYVLDANLALTGATQTITTNAANLTLAGGTIENANSTSALASLATNTGTLTIGGTSNNVSTTATSFSNTGTLTINSGDSLTATKLTQISGTTLSGGTFVLAGNLDLTTAGISVTTNSSTLTLEGGTINSNGVNALSGLTTNTKTLTLAGSATLTTAASNFTNSGTVTVQKGTTLTVGGTSKSYNQTAGTTTIDGTLSGGTTGSSSFTGGTVLGAGTLKANTTVGNASGTAVTINVGDTGAAGLLTITGTYKQLATGNMTGLINGTTAGSGYSQLKISGTAALAGTIGFTVATAFQSSLTVGETFTVLTASSVSGSFSNSTIAINSSFHFTVSYTATGVVLTVASGAAPSSSNAAQPAAVATVNSKPSTTAKNRIAVPVNNPRRGNSIRATHSVLVAGLAPSTARSNAILVRASELNDLRSWERIPIVVDPVVRPLAVTAPRIGETNSTHEEPASDLRTLQNHAIGVRTPVAGWTGTSTNRREPVKIMPPMSPRISR
jgi:fibronectin-binding autotransporter adhesin